MAIWRMGTNIQLSHNPLRKSEGGAMLSLLPQGARRPDSWLLSFIHLEPHPCPPSFSLSASSHPGQRTCQDGLVNPEGGGFDGEDADVCGDFVPHCGESREQRGQSGMELYSSLRKSQSWFDSSSHPS